MKIVVFSDSHGSYENMVQAVEISRPDAIIYLGDGQHDAQRLRDRFPDLPFYAVAGNCDFGCREPRELMLCLEGKNLLLCHGHTLNVKHGLLTALYTARERGADALLFGHTHQPFIDYRDGVWLFNPGSVGDYLHPTYGVLTIEGDKLSPATYTL